VLLQQGKSVEEVAFALKAHAADAAAASTFSSQLHLRTWTLCAGGGTEGDIDQHWSRGSVASGYEPPERPRPSASRRGRSPSLRLPAHEDSPAPARRGSRTPSAGSRPPSRSRSHSPGRQTLITFNEQLWMIRDHRGHRKGWSRLGMNISNSNEYSTTLATIVTLLHSWSISS
jgi:hypothetical protein